MRHCVALLLLLAFALVGCRKRGTTETFAPVAELKCKDCNLVFVSFDALQAAHVGSLGYPRNVTPTIDAMAKEGYSFTQAHAVASWTVPSSMTWFTGVYPSEHRMINKFTVYLPTLKKPANLKELSPELLTLADLLRANGYATGGFTGNAGVSGGFGYEQGFDVYFHEKNKFGSMDESIPQALAWLKQNKDRKHFVFLHGYDCHGQNTPAEGFDYRFVDADYDRRYTGSEQQQEILREEGLERGQLTMRDADVRFWRAIYDEKIQRSDTKFKDFLAAYEQLNPKHPTLWVLTSDHGTEFYEHRRFDHGFTLYDEQIHVPLIFKIPGMAGGKKLTDRISSIDVMPTILDLLDIPLDERAKKQLRGRSLAPTMLGQHEPRDLFAETDYREYSFKRAILTPDGWKFILTLESQTKELYDLGTDPGETTNLVAKHPARVQELEAKLHAHFKAIGHDLKERRWLPGLNPVYNSQAKDPPKK